MNLLPLTYLGNVQYFAKLCFAPCVIDIHEHFVKQSYRSRCDILAAGGPLSLTVQTVRPSGGGCAVRDMRIDYSKRWQHQHWYSIRSAYKSSPYFDYYGGELAPFYERRYEFLLDYDLGLLRLMFRLLGAEVPLRFSERYLSPGEAEEAGFSDFRSSLSPKPRLHRPDPSFDPVPYYQVFSERMPFVPNLSVIDLLFCEGPGAREILRRSCRP